jgi:hypothetical protein
MLKSTFRSQNLRRFLVAEAVELFCHEELDEETKAYFEEMSTLNLFTIISGEP